MRRVTAFLAGVLLLLVAAPAAHAALADEAALQAALAQRGLYAGSVDGVRGPATTAAVQRLQAAEGLAADGIPGPATRKALGWRGRPQLGGRLLRAGRKGWDVAGLQFLLGRAGFPSGDVDGVLGSHTDAALRRFQAWAGLTADGLAGPGTLAALRRPAPRSPLGLLKPVAAAIGDRFGPRGDRFHSGLDFTASLGQAVTAAGRGCVASAGWDSGGYGNLVVLSHRLGVTTWYAHLSSIAVVPGQCVTAGSLVGRVGSTGISTGPHLHFEVRLRNATVDPLSAGL
jgi:murein DD-endopeptidase MepM/ murein hydrolase activator NlpD